MKICIIGKYPPIQGGVSAKTYWLARGLGSRGHHVYLVTNAMEVEDEYRIQIDSEDISQYQPKNVAVYNTNFFSAPKYIPYANPFVSKLSSIAVKLIQNHNIDLIYAEYFEPYCVAGFLAKCICKKPLIVRHAGSDITRLFHDNILHNTYLEILKNTDLIMTTRGGGTFFEQLGIKRDRINTDSTYGLNDAVFTPSVTPIKWENILDNYNGEPVILMYGKAGITKGSFDIINALPKISTNFKLCYITNPSMQTKLRQHARRIGVEKKVSFLSFISNARIPSFIKACDVACFLERDFPITVHGPLVPREVMSVGKCLVVSQEIFEKQYFKNDLVHMDNIVVVDPKKTDELALQLSILLSNKALSEKIGINGFDIFKKYNDFNSFITTHENAFNDVILKEK